MPEIAQIRANVLNNFSACQLSQCTLARFVNVVSLEINLKCSLSMCVCLLSRLSGFQFFVTLQIRANQAPLSIGFSRQEYCSGLPCPSSADSVFIYNKKDYLRTLKTKMCILFIELLYICNTEDNFLV